MFPALEKFDAREGEKLAVNKKLASKVRKQINVNRMTEGVKGYLTDRAVRGQMHKLMAAQKQVLTGALHAVCGRASHSSPFHRLLMVYRCTRTHSPPPPRRANRSLFGLNRPISVYRFPRRALTLCPQLCMGISPRRYTEIGLLSTSVR